MAIDATLPQPGSPVRRAAGHVRAAQRPARRGLSAMTAARIRGGAALSVVLTVAGMLLLLAGVVHGHLLTSQRLATNQQRAAVAAEAADAGRSTGCWGG